MLGKIFFRIYLNKKITIWIILTALMLVGGFFRLYNLNWDQNHFMHPDERFIGGSVWWLVYGTNSNPNFFSYGSFPLYFSTFIFRILHRLWNLSENAVWIYAMLLGRLISASLSLLLIPGVYRLTLFFSEAKSKKTALLAAFFTTTSVGLIQYAHFATYELILSTEYFLLLFFCLKLIQEKKFTFRIYVYTFLTAVIFGLSLSSKITSIAFLPLPFVAILYSKSTESLSRKKIVVEKIFHSVFFLLISAVVSFATAPYNVLDFRSFLFSISYELQVSTHGIEIFFTDQFTNSIPVLYQLTKIFPWILNPVLAILFVPSFAWLIYKSVKDRNKKPYTLLLISSSIVLSQCFLFIKWTRYMIPLLPFFYIFVSLFMSEIGRKLSTVWQKVIIFSVIALSLFWASAFFTIYTRLDTRIAAANWMKDNIPSDAKVLTEDMDSGFMPIKAYFTQLKQFNFYDLDGSDAKTQNEQLKKEIIASDYFVVLSRHVYENRLANQNKFPNGAAFYNKLFDKTLGFELIYQSPNNFSFFGIEIDDSNSDLSFQNFDHPRLLIFKKVNKF